LISNEFVAQALHNWKAAASFAKPAFESTITVGDSLVDTKITAYLRQWLGTNNRVGEALKGGQVLVNARTVYSNYVLKMGDLIQFRLTDAKRGEEADTDEKLVGRLTSFVNILLNPDQNPGLQILYEDDDVAVVLKPSGVHALAWTGTMKKNSFALDAVLPIILTPPDSGSESYAESLTRPLPCHRLDARVAGCLLIGKTVSALSSLNRQFENRTIAKEYTAVVCGNVTSALGGESEAVIEAEVNGAAAQSVFTVKEVVPCNVYGSMSRLTLNPHSGRRHQLRQHCAW
jgi:23S rRNA-/tRNA-specific pseudouridylate synthase